MTVALRLQLRSPDETVTEQRIQDELRQLTEATRKLREELRALVREPYRVVHRRDYEDAAGTPGAGPSE